MTEGALVLEGGSMRCQFTAGVLDVFMEEGIELSYVIGVSAGSLSGMNYLSKQIGRTSRINIEYANDSRYFGFRNFIRRHSVFNFDFLFGEIANTLIPLDVQTFMESKQRFHVVTTNCKTGREEYFDKEDCEDIMMASRASCSMPLLSPRVTLGDSCYLDGGIAMPIAYHKALAEGYQKVVVVLTREHGYRKADQGRALLSAYDRVYKDYPDLRQTLRAIPSHYNQMQEEIDTLEAKGKIFVIRPELPVEVSRMEKDVKRLEQLYQIGRSIAQKQLEQLKNYLGSCNC